jgi:hypothetical protein
MAKFSVVMPSNAGIIPQDVIVEADSIQIHPLTNQITLVAGQTDDIVSVIPQGSLVYKVAEKENEKEVEPGKSIEDQWKDWINDQFKADLILVRKVEIDELKSKLNEEKEKAERVINAFTQLKDAFTA